MAQTTLGERISLILQEQKLKKVAFAKSLGISANYVSLLAGGKKIAISQTLAKLIESTYGYRTQWLLTGALPIRPDEELCSLQEDMLEKVRRMDRSELYSVDAFIKDLEKSGTI